MKKILIPLLSVLCLLSSCKKENSGPEPTAHKEIEEILNLYGKSKSQVNEHIGKDPVKETNNEGEGTKTLFYKFSTEIAYEAKLTFKENIVNDVQVDFTIKSNSKDAYLRTFDIAKYMSVMLNDKYEDTGVYLCKTIIQSESSSVPSAPIYCNNYFDQGLEINAHKHQIAYQAEFVETWTSDALVAKHEILIGASRNVIKMSTQISTKK